MSDTYERFKYNPVSITVLKGYTEEQLYAEMSAKIKRAEQLLHANFTKDLLSGDANHIELTPEKIAEYERWKRKRKLLAPWYWLKLRIVGTYRVWVYGSSEEENEQDY